MMIWLVFLIAALAAFAASIVFLVTKIGQTGLVKKLAKECRWKRRLFSFLILLLVLVLVYMALGFVNTVVCLLHVTAFVLAAQFVCRLLRGTAFFQKRGITGRSTVPLYGGLLLAAIYLSVGWYLAHHVTATHYSLQTGGDEQLRVVMFADSHVGATFHADDFADYVEEMNSQHPDVVLVVGDFVDDATSKEDMLGASAALANLQSTYGTYFVWGNHDKGYYDNSRRGYNEDDLRSALQQSHVTILEDEVAVLSDSFCLVGRNDLSEDMKGRPRKAIGELMQGIPENSYSIVMDHQPSDYEAEKNAGASLVVSGHTHGGQLIPITFVGEWLGMNDRTYGYEKRGDTEYLVTSGIGDWAIAFKTGCSAEYVVIDINE